MTAVVAEHLSTVAIAVLVLACLVTLFLVGGLLRRTRAWHGLGMFSLVVGALTVVLVACLCLSSAPAPPLAGLRIGGLAERLVIFDRDVWFAALGWLLYRGAPVARADLPRRIGRPTAPHRPAV